jgi:hypothetical protein
VAFQLRAGDSASIPGSVDYRIRNAGPDPASFLFLTFNPRYKLQPHPAP